MKRRLLIALLASVALGISPATPAADAKKLRIGVEGAYPPFSQVGPDGQLRGFDIDIARALCAKMQAECTLVQQDFDGMIPALLSRKFDAVVASMSITEERKKSVAFTDKYASVPARMVARLPAKFDVTPEGLKGRKIGVQRSTIHDRYVSEFFKGSQIVRYTKQDEVYLDLAAGRIDATLQDSAAADIGFLKTPQGKGYGFVGPLYDDPKWFGVGAGIALRKGDAELQRKFNAAIQAIRADGTYKTLQDKYFDFDVYGR